MSDKAICFWCGRTVGINPNTGNLRFHHFPKGQELPFFWVVAGERCLGTGRTPRKIGD